MFCRYNTTSNYTRYYKDYIKLYNTTIRKIINKLDNSRPYLLSSPTNGKSTDEQGGVAKDPYDPYYGDGGLRRVFSIEK